MQKTVLSLLLVITINLPCLSAEKTPAKTKAETKQVQKKNKSSTLKKDRLIPPPPPETALVGGTYGPLSIPFEYLSLTELEKLQVNTQSELNKQKETVDNIREATSEKKEHAQLFETLYKEGVVSRKELVQAKAEASTVDREITDAENKLIEIESKLNAVSKYIQQKKNKKTNSSIKRQK
jgi:hypothetical protein